MSRSDAEKLDRNRCIHAWRKRLSVKGVGSASSRSLLGYLWFEDLARQFQRKVSDASVFTAIILSDVSVATERPSYELLAQWNPDEDNIYRVSIQPVSGKVEVISIGIDHEDSVEGTYKRVTDLPVWMQEKLAALSIMSMKPPTTKVEGVGQRIDQHTFWVTRG